MKDIKFRGLVKGIGDIKRWAYGGIFYIGKRAFIVPDDVEITEDWDGSPAIVDFIEVIPETVGQYIGRHDESKKEIYDGDILEEVRLIGCSRKNGEIKETSRYIIEYQPPCFLSNPLFPNNSTPNYAKSKIIGNCQDNPGLLKKGAL